MPILPGLFDEFCQMVKVKIDADVYEPSNSSYRSRWFTVLKKGGASLRIIHSLEPLNAVTIAHSGVPPHTEQITEQFARHACGGILDLYVGYDERALDERSRDYTTFQTPFGAMRLVTLPMGWTNSVPIFHDDVTYTVGNKTFPMFATSAQMHLYLSKYISQNHKNNNADALTSYLKHSTTLSSHALFWHDFHMVQIGHSLERFRCHQFL